MKMPVKQQDGNRNIRQKLIAALSMLLVSTILLTTTSYAWFVLSVAPEVTGITTNVGANGSLEIALLNTQTRQDMSTIRSAAGDSLAQNRPTGNNTWGNLVDLSDAGYGLSGVTLLPARLDASASGDGFTVNSGLLAIPTYGYDGRVIDVTENAMSAVYSANGFSLTLGEQDYGVRAVGTTSSMSVQESELAAAKTNISTYTNSAKTGAIDALQNNGSAMFDVILAHAMDSAATYNDENVSNLKKLVTDLQTSVDYIDLALRYGVVAIAASETSDEDTFILLRDTVMNQEKELSSIMQELNIQGAIPGDFTNWVSGLDEIQNNLNDASNACDVLTSGTYSWEDIRGVLDKIMNVNGIFINEFSYDELNMDTATSLLGKDIVVTLAPGSGLLVEIADYVDNYSTFVRVDILGEIEIITASTVETPYLSVLAAAVRTLEAADSSGNDTAVTLTATYGYALDLAFRCNAANADLLLQTTPEQRIYEESTSVSTMGGGSFMEFTSMDENLTMEQKLLLMDAIRVGFLDDMGNLLCVAKLNTSNHTGGSAATKASLYIYDYAFSAEDGSMIMGERQVAENTITTLNQNTPKAITVVVWLDGDMVDNSMVSATNSTSLGGTLNLQFATSANLVPAANSDLLNVTSDKKGLNALIVSQTSTVQAGQGTYTTASWEAFIKAYDYAATVSNDDNATESQIYNAALNLTKTANALEAVSKNTLTNQISSLRAEMGQTDDVAFVVVKDASGSYQTVVPDAADGAGEKVGDIYSVDTDMNLRDEGNDFKTPIYTDASWAAMAELLYNAELLNLDPNATDAQIDETITALEETWANMEYAVLFEPHDYNGTIYYMANTDETDTYGKWYESNFQRIISDRTTLLLDANAEPAQIAVIEHPDYLNYKTGVSAPVVTLQDKVYTELAGEQIADVTWSNPAANLNGSMTGAVTIRAMVQTENGIVCTAEKNVTVYIPADGVKICVADLNAPDDADELTELNMESNYTDSISAKLFFNAADHADELVNGTAPTVHTETVSEYVWASSDTNVVSISDMGSETCTLTAKDAGTAYITLSVTTVQGNTYTAKVTVTVS